MITIVDVADAASISPRSAARLRMIHEAAFPARERHYSMQYMLERTGRSDSIMRVIRLDGRPIGYAYVELVPEIAAAFLWYIAVDASLRGRGIGAEAITDTLRMLRSDHPDLRYAFFEIGRSDGHGHPSDGGAEPRLRGFYRRLGAYWIRGTDYVIPAADDPNDSVAYDPMFFALRGTFDPREVRDAVTLMAADTYEGRAEDPRWKHLQDSVNHAVIVPPNGTSIARGPAGLSGSGPRS